MHPFFEAYLERHTALHRQLVETLEGLPQAALDWEPGPGMNTFNILIVHLTAAERYWVGDVARGEPSGRVRAQEFETRGLEAANLRERLAASRGYIEAACAQLRLEDLAGLRRSPMDGREVTAGWCLLHALEHTAIHVGHLQVLRQLWEAQNGK
jgi:uncharacterized damage-inducible protein DinB